MTTNQLIFAIIAAIWASMSARIAGFTSINQRRDAIILGYIDKVPISLEHRKLIYERDWRPLAFSIISVSFLFSFVILVLPCFLPGSEVNSWVWVLCFAVAIFHFASAVLTIRHFIVESQFIKSQLLEGRRTDVDTSSMDSLKTPLA